MDFLKYAQALKEEILAQALLVCKSCGQKAIIELKNEGTYARCTWRSCRKIVSIWKGTIFEDSKLGIDKCFLILYLWMYKYTTIQIYRETSLSRPSLRRFLRLVAKTAVPNYLRKFGKIGGSSTIVEIDESKFRKRKYHRGHVVEGVWGFGMVERAVPRRIILLPVEKRNRETLVPLLQRYVEKDSVIYSDMWKAYSGLDTYFLMHNTVNHSQEFVNHKNCAHQHYRRQLVCDKTRLSYANKAKKSNSSISS